LTSVCLSVEYIGPKSRTERPRKTKIGTEVAHVTCDSGTTFNVNQAALLTAAFTHQAATAVTVGTYSHRGNLLLRCRQARSARWREALRRPQKEERAGHIVAAPAQLTTTTTTNSTAKFNRFNTVCGQRRAILRK